MASPIRPAAPRNSARAPSYPRILGLTIALAAAACGGNALDDAPRGTGGTDQGTGGTAGEEPDAWPNPAGDIAEPFDASPEAEAQPDAEPDTWPNPAGDIAEPFDASPEAEVDAWPSTDSAGADTGLFDVMIEEPDADDGGIDSANSAGDIAEAYDAG